MKTRMGTRVVRKVHSLRKSQIGVIPDRIVRSQSNYRVTDLQLCRVIQAETMSCTTEIAHCSSDLRQFNPYTPRDTFVLKLETRKFLIWQSLKLPHWHWNTFCLALKKCLALVLSNVLYCIVVVTVMKQWKRPHPVIECWVLSLCPQTRSSIHLETAPGFVSWCSNERVLALLFLALEKSCSSSQIKPELIRIIGMYYIYSILCWIFPSTPCWKHVWRVWGPGMHVKPRTQLKHIFPAAEFKEQLFFFAPFISLLAWTISLLKGCCVGVVLQHLWQVKVQINHVCSRKLLGWGLEGLVHLILGIEPA